MIIRALVPGDEGALEGFLVPRLTSSMFLVGNARRAGLADTGAPYSGTYVAAFEDGAMVAVVAHFWNNALIVQAPVHAGALAREAVARSGRPVGMLIGPEAQVSAAWEGLDVAPERVRMDECEKRAPYRPTARAREEPDRPSGPARLS